MVTMLPNNRLNHTEVPTSELISIFCEIDDFCNWFEPLYQQRLLQDGQRNGCERDS